MKYINANTVLPKELILELQKYVQGELLYIPKSAQSHKHWGENTDTKRLIAARNEEILEKYRNGITIENLAASYYLSHETIKKIVYGKRQQIK